MLFPNLNASIRRVKDKLYLLNFYLFLALVSQKIAFSCKNSIAQLHYEYAKNVFACFFDQEKAYDRIPPRECVGK